jgi:hypothetical protein
MFDARFDTILGSDLSRNLSHLPDDIQGKIRERVLRAHEGGADSGQIQSQLRSFLGQYKDAKGSAVSRKTIRSKTRDPNYTQSPDVLDTPDRTSNLGDKGKMWQAAASNLVNIPRDLIDVAALGHRYLNPAGWIQGDKVFDDTAKLHDAIDKAVPIYNDLGEAREVAREDYLATANSPSAARKALFAAELLEPTSNNPAGLARLAGKMALVGTGAYGARKLGRKIGRATAPTLDDTSRQTMRRSISGADTQAYDELAASLREKAELKNAELRMQEEDLLTDPDYMQAHDTLYQEIPVKKDKLKSLLKRAERTEDPIKKERVFNRTVRLETKVADTENAAIDVLVDKSKGLEESQEFITALDRKASILEGRAREINAAREKYGVYLDEAKFTQAELATANGLREAENARQLYHFLPEDEFKSTADMIKGIAAREAKETPALGKSEQGFDKFYQFLKKNFGSRRGLPEDVFMSKIKADQEPILGAYQMRQKAEAIKELVERKYGDIELYDQVDNLLTAKEARLPGDVHAIAQSMRDDLDNLSMQLLDNPSLQNASPDLRQKLSDNLGKYLHRDYAVIENPFWQKDVSPEIVGKAKEFLKRDYDLTDDQIEGIIRASTTQKNNPLLVLNANKVSSTGRRVLRARKNVPPAMRALLGEHTDPFHKAVRSSYYMHSLAAEMDFNQKLGPMLAEQGLGVASPIATGKFTRELPNSPGFFVSDDIADILEEQTKLKANSFSLMLNGLTKAHNTVLSPTTHVKNFISNGWVAMALGHIPNVIDPIGRKGARALRTEKAASPEITQMVEELIQEGALGTNVDVGDLLEFENSMNYYMRKATGKKVSEKYEKLMDFGTKWYLTGDNYWKVSIYNKEIKQYTKALMDSGMTRSAAETEAKKRAVRVVRDATQNYNFLPRVGRKIRESAIIGPFASFPIESMRNFRNLVNIMYDDLADPVTRKIGLRRAAGVMASVTAEYAGSRWASTFTNVGRNVNQAVVPFLPEYHQDGEIVPYKWDPTTGQMEYSIMSDGNYYNYPMSIMRSATAPSQDPAEWAGNFLGAVAGDIVSPSLILGPISEYWQTGDMKQAGKKLVKNVTPGLVRDPLEAARAADVPGVSRIIGPTPVSRADRTAIEQLGGKAVGVQRYKLDIKKRFRGEISELRRSADSQGRRIAELTNQSDKFEAQRQYQEKWRQAGERTLFLIQQLRNAGIDDYYISQWLPSYTNNHKIYLLQGEIPPAPVPKE